MVPQPLICPNLVNLEEVVCLPQSAQKMPSNSAATPTYSALDQVLAAGTLLVSGFTGEVVGTCFRVGGRDENLGIFAAR